MTGLRTYCVQGDVVYIAVGRPDPDNCVALGEAGLSITQSGEVDTFSWVDLESVEFLVRRSWRGRAGGPVRFLLWALWYAYAAFSVTLFVITFGGLGGAPPRKEDVLWVTPQLRGRPTAYSIAYRAPVAWPRDCTEAEAHWFEVLSNALCGSRRRLLVPGLVNALESSPTTEVLESLLSEMVVPDSGL